MFAQEWLKKYKIAAGDKSENEKSRWNTCLCQKLQSGGGKKSSASAVTSEWKNLWLGMSLPEMLTNPISTPLPISDLHFFVLEGRKEKIPAYRGTGAPTHFQEQVSRRTWLVQSVHNFLAQGGQGSRMGAVRGRVDLSLLHSTAMIVVRGWGADLMLWI